MGRKKTPITFTSDINNFDEVVGCSQTGSGNHAFLWDAAAGMLDLNDLVTAPGWVLVSAAAINNAVESWLRQISQPAVLYFTAVFQHNHHMRQFIRELRQRNVFKVAIIYVIAGWVLLQVADVLFAALNLPEWTVTLVAGLLIIGFPLAMILAWAFELTPQGLRRETKATPATADRVDERLTGDDSRHAAKTAPAQALASAKSIAVLPFADFSAERDSEYFADGLTEELLNVLSKVNDLRVSSRTSCFAFKGKDSDVRSVARTLGVSHVLEGSVRKAGNTLRITAQFIDAANDAHIWSETYDRELDDIFAIQDDIA